MPLINGLARIEQMEYNSLGNLICHYDANGNCTEKKCTIRGKPYKIFYPDGSVEEKEYRLLVPNP